MRRLLLPLLAGLVVTTAPALAFNPQGYGGFYTATVGRPTVTVVTPQYNPHYGYNVVHVPRGGDVYGHRRGNWRQRAYAVNPHWGHPQRVVYQQPVYTAPCPPPPPPQYGHGYGHPYHHPYGY
jgi:hypothetical protein